MNASGRVAVPTASQPGFHLVMCVCYICNALLVFLIQVQVCAVM
jgi:hypothetical protein